jgi:hypothetical protein
MFNLNNIFFQIEENFKGVFEELELLGVNEER